MSTSYELTLSRAVEPSAMLERLGPCLPRPLPEPGRTTDGLTLPLNDSMGFALSVGVRDNWFVDAFGDDGDLVWELPSSSTLTFWIDDDHLDLAPRNVVSVVSQALRTGDEDLAFTFNSERLYLVRQNNIITKHDRADFWDLYPQLNDLIPD